MPDTNTSVDLQPDAHHTTYDTVAQLTASQEAPRGVNAVWRVRSETGEFIYRELAPSNSAHHIVTQNGVLLQVSSVNGVFHADAFNAVGDGATDDTAAIQRAFDAMPQNATLRFSSGRTYLVSAGISSARGNSLTVQATGATFRCADDSVWHIFSLGGTSAEETQCTIRWHGGTFDGNVANQRYYPNTDGVTIFTDRGEETFGSHIGMPFYENSPVNGTSWSDDWINGTGNDGINVNGGGNEGLIRVQHAQCAIFEDIEFRDFVRNGLVTWNVHDVHATRIRGIGQLPTCYFELVSLFDLGHEASLMKFSGGSDSSIINGNYSERITVSDCYAEGGAMPLFVRTNPPKSPAVGIAAKISGCQFYGISREAWFETCQSLNLRDCDIACSDYPQSTYRKGPAIFIGSGTQDWTIDNCYVYGRVNTNTSQALRVGSFVNSILIDYSNQELRCLDCELVADSYVESRSGGVLANRITGSRFLLENKEGSESFKIRSSITSSTLGMERFESTRERQRVEQGQETVQISGRPDVVQRVLIRRRGFHEGRWFEAHQSDYRIYGDNIYLQNGNGAFFANQGPVDVEIDWYAERVDTFTTNLAQNPEGFVLTQTGGCRTQDITSVTYNGSALSHRHDVEDPITDPHWTSKMTETGRVSLALENSSLILVDGGELVVRYRPPLAPYRALETGTRDTDIDATGVNFEGIICDGGRNYVRGIFKDISGSAFFRFKDGTDLVELKDLKLDRLNGGVLCGINSTAACNEGYVIGCHIRDWMLQTSRLQNLSFVLNDKAVGSHRRNGTQFLSRFSFTDTIMEYTGIECGASRVTGNNQSGVLVNGYAMVGGNMYLGVTKGILAGVGDFSTLLSKPDMA